jgi:hypothetical protein
MPNRYENINQTTRWDGKKTLTTVYYPSIPESDNDIFIVSNETDYLDTLAYKYYRDTSLFWIIAQANNLGKGRMSVQPGLQLRIPGSIASILSDFERINS